MTASEEPRGPITEINGDWLDVVALGGRPVLATQPPGFTYPSDTNEVRPGLFLSADYTSPGAIETFTSNGKLRWRYAPTGAAALNARRWRWRCPTATSSPTMTRTTA
jgi:hypothetical protein